MLQMRRPISRYSPQGNLTVCSHIVSTPVAHDYAFRKHEVIQQPHEPLALVRTNKDRSMQRQPSNRTDSSSNMEREHSTPRVQRQQQSSTMRTEPDSSPHVQRQTSKSRLGRSFSSRRLSSPSDLFQRLSGSPSKNSFYVNEEAPTALDEALELLNLRDVAGLEDNFLGTDAFLRPWAFFRDNFLLVQPKGKPRASPPGQTTRLDMLWWYTFFEDGQMRYNPLADEDSWEYEEDTSKHGVIDRTHWGVEEHEKYLYAWLLQTFKVGKTVNPYGFEYFEERNICTAWVEVFMPVLDAVRKDYDHPSRFRYGRLAKFIEEACPSHFTLPESNTRQGIQRTITPAVTLGISLRSITPHVQREPSPRKADPVTGVLWSKKVYDDDEKELKRTYPLYGHLGELPKFKTVMKDWLRQQKEAISRKRTLRHLEGASSTPRTSLHGQTFHYDYGQSSPYETMKTETVARKDSDKSDYSKLSSVKPSPRRRPSVKREGSDGVYSAIRSSNPFTEHETQVLGAALRHHRQPSHGSDRSVMVPVEAKPSPLKTLAARYPSYEGNSYGSLPTLREMKSQERVRGTRIPSPVEVPPAGNARGYHPVVEKAASRAETMPLHTETVSSIPVGLPSAGDTRGYHPIVEKAVVRAETTPLPTEPAPPIPFKSPYRHGSIHSFARGPRSDISTASDCKTLNDRIISKENIRAVVGSLSRENSGESLKEKNTPGVSYTDAHAFARIGGRGMNTGEVPSLPTFNTHMFPRDGGQTPMGSSRKKLVDYHEMEVLRGKGRAD
ncbi:hypothetical protein K491DRAFT_760851 [Lophiostoma macrostomum CBS 122681]|uniref:Uncharacterized protein n=1 Tax=Lophiostoma macrostomum CBS 122681 TaxID=1314788 RepID=A0A6A6SXE9_9PLEO|nr:hypothetical protein K491DRAFT_760851 [Lophiostoma macrostomum CBS 122681]